MRTRAVHYAALVSLIIQAILGSVSPVAALCIKTNHELAASSQPEAAPSSCSVPGKCCHHDDRDDAHDRGVIALTPPCDDGCVDCVDVLLPDEALGFGPRAGDLTDTQPIAADCLTVAWPPVIERFPPGGMEGGTGPPGLRACPHRAVISSTRLLI